MIEANPNPNPNPNADPGRPLIGAVRDNQRLDEVALNTWFRAHVADPAEPLSLSQFNRDARLPGLAPAERAASYDALGETLARLHRIDPAAIGLADFGRPGNYFARQIDRWTKQYLGAQTETLPAMERLMADIAYGCILYHSNSESWGTLDSVALQAAGIPDEDAYVAAYCRRTDRSAIAGFNVYLAFSMFRLAAIGQGVYKRKLLGIGNTLAVPDNAHTRRSAEAACAILDR